MSLSMENPFNKPFLDPVTGTVFSPAFILDYEGGKTEQIIEEVVAEVTPQEIENLLSGSETYPATYTYTPLMPFFATEEAALNFVKGGLELGLLQAMVNQGHYEFAGRFQSSPPHIDPARPEDVTFVFHIERGDSSSNDQLAA